MASFFKKKLKSQNSTTLLNEKNDKNENSPIASNHDGISSNNPSESKNSSSIQINNKYSNTKSNLKNTNNNDSIQNSSNESTNNYDNQENIKEKNNSKNINNESNTNQTNTDESNNDKNKNIWIDVVYDPFNGIQTISDCMGLVDIDGINQHHLVIADFGNYRDNINMKSSLVSMNDDLSSVNKKLNKSNENDINDPKKVNEKKGRKTRAPSIVLNKNDVALNDNKIGIPVLKIFKDDHIETKIDLPDIPRALCSFYSDQQQGTHPTIAVAIGTTIYMYRDRYPYIKMTLPPVEANPLEDEAWKSAVTKANNVNKMYNQTSDIKVSNISESDLSLSEAREKSKNQGEKKSENGSTEITPVNNEEMHSKLIEIVNELVDALTKLRDNGIIQLTQISIEFLSLEDIEMKLAFLIGNLDINISIEPTITTMTKINKNLEDENSLSYLVVGVNEKLVYIVNPNGCQVIEKFQLSSSVQLLSVYGLYDSKYHIVVGCFDGSLYYLTSNSCYKIVQLEFLPIGMVAFEKTLIVGCMNNTIYSYTVSGKKQYSIVMPSPIVNIQELSTKMKKIKGYAVSLQSNEVRIFSDKNLILTIPTPDIITGMIFGNFEREQNGLIMTTKNGGLIIKYLKRNATSTLDDINIRPPPEQKQPIAVPKKTRLYIDQSVREKENAKEMHSIFQRDLFRMKLIAARAYVKTFKNTLNPISTTPSARIKMMLEVMGINVNFKIRLDIINIGNNIAKNLYLIFDYDDELFTIEKPMINIPIILPGVNYTIDCEIKQNTEVYEEKESSNQIRVFLCEKGHLSPLVTGIADVGMCQDLLETYG